MVTSMSLTSSASPEATLLSVSTVSDYVELMKPGVMSLVVFTGVAGMALAQCQSGGALAPPATISDLALYCAGQRCRGSDEHVV